MLLFGLVFPLLLIALAKPSRIRWNILRLVASYFLIFSFLEIVGNYLGLNLVARSIILIVFGLFEASNLEHVINNNSNQNFIFIKFLFDPVFLKGSGLTKRFFFRILAIQITVLLFLFLNLRFNDLSTYSMLTISILSFYFIPKSLLFQDWLQENWIFFNLRNFFTAHQNEKKNHLRKDVSLSRDKIAQLDARYLTHRPLEMGTSNWLKNRGQPTNVLLIVIEGLGETHFQKGWLPRLTKRRNNNVFVKSFINHQRNTNRGLYSLYSGKHPNLIDQMAKPDIVAQYGKLDVGIAEILANHGYTTSYMQGAPSVFMYKDLFLPILGFQEIIGEEKFSKEVPRIKWGIDDHELYKQASCKIEQLQSQSSPWFLSLLTVSTHHPIQASNKVLKNLEDGFIYADEELEIFLAHLEVSGILDSTLVLITSDETTGDGSHILSENLGSLTMLLPEQVTKVIEIPFAQSDVALSLCDYLQIEKHPFVGRSFFRDYDDERPLYFSSIFQQKAFGYFNQKLFIQNYSGVKEIFSVPSLDLMTIPVIVAEPDAVSFDLLNDFIKCSDRGLECLTSPVILDLKQLEPNGTDTVKSGSFIKVGLKRGETIELKFAAENINNTAPVVVCWLIQDMKYKRSFKLNTIVFPLSKEAYTKSYTCVKDSWFDLSIRVTCGENRDWILRDLQITHV